MNSEDTLFAKIEKLYINLKKERKALLEQYKALNQKYPIGFTFPYKGETAKINGCFAELIEPDNISQFAFTVYIHYACYVSKICDLEIKTQSGAKVIGDHKNIGVSILQVEIDRILEGLLD